MKRDFLAIAGSVAFLLTLGSRSPAYAQGGHYGATSGLGATDSFIEDLYSSLTAKK